MVRCVSQGTGLLDIVPYRANAYFKGPFISDSFRDNLTYPVSITAHELARGNIAFSFGEIVEKTFKCFNRIR